jgi:hypothetical protein
MIRASKAARMVRCPGSLRMERNAPPRPESDDAKEGTAAHWVGEMVLSGQAPDTIALVDRLAPNGVIVTIEMAEYVDIYVDHIRSRSGGQLHIERSFKFDVNNITITGTSDSVYVTDDTIYVDDLKYGFRLVNPVENWQLLIYAMGSVLSMPGTYVPKRIVMSIVQPRPWHRGGPIRSWEVTYDQLNEWYKELTVNATEAMRDDAPLKSGEHCIYCDARNECPAWQRAGMNAIDIICDGVNDILTPGALSMELTNLRRAKTVLESRLAALEEMAKERVKAGNLIPGYDIQRSYGHAKWLKTVDAPTLEMMTGKCLSEQKLVTPAEAKRRGVSEEIVKAFTERPDNGFKLIQIDLDQTAKELFNHG